MSTPTEQLLVTGTAVGQHCMADPYETVRTTLTIRAIVSRDQIAAAVDYSLHNYYAGDRHPDAWTIAEVRHHAEFQILYGNALELQQGAEAMAEMARPDFYDEWARERVQAVYRAVDRAFPELAKTL